MDNSLEIDLLEEILERNKKLRFKALGSSMFPFIKSGDLITIKPLENSNVYIGDILFYKKKDELIVHRLIKKVTYNGDIVFITKGDNRKFQDAPINMSQILGKVVKIERGEKIIKINSNLWRLFNYLISQIPFYIINSLMLKVRFIRKFPI